MAASVAESVRVNMFLDDPNYPLQSSFFRDSRKETMTLGFGVILFYFSSKFCFNKISFSQIVWLIYMALLERHRIPLLSWTKRCPGAAWTYRDRKIAMHSLIQLLIWKGACLRHHWGELQRAVPARTPAPPPRRPRRHNKRAGAAITCMRAGASDCALPLRADGVAWLCAVIRWVSP